MAPRRRGAGRADRDILTKEQAAEFLQLQPRVLTELAKAGKVPARRIGRTFRFSRAALLAWIEAGEPGDDPADAEE